MTAPPIDSRAALLTWLRHAQSAGLRYLIRSPRAPVVADAAVPPDAVARDATLGAASAPAPADASATVAVPRVVPEPSDTARFDALAEIEAEVAACRLCDALVANRTQTVFADGSPHAPLMFLGEAPGADEDREGVPFVGAAGRKLTEIIEKGMGIPRREVYIANILKCRPPGNRDPEPAEVHRCTVYLERQIEVVRPRVIVALGLFAAHWLLDTTESLGRLRGRVHTWRDGIQVVVTYHPSWLLRSYTLENRKKVFEDIQLCVSVLEDLGVYPWW